MKSIVNSAHQQAQGGRLSDILVVERIIGRDSSIVALTDIQITRKECDVWAVCATVDIAQTYDQRLTLVINFLRNDLKP